jgi:Zn-dependent peptidase ImmA (M78 family)
VNSSLQAVLESLELIWAPGAEAAKVQQALGVRSLADMAAALERAGYEVCYVDLPERVSGFAKVIEGKPHIVLNRAKSAEHLRFTVSHELGHHVLHLDASRDPQTGLPSEGIAEFQAHQFATLWVLLVANDKERQDVLNQNPEWLLVGATSLLMTAGVILIPLIAHLWSSLSGLPRPVADK